VLNALQDYYSYHNANVHRGAHRLSREATSLYEEARDSLAGLVNCDRSEIVFTKGATEGINLIASTWGRANLVYGDEIVLSVLEHHSNIVPWQLLQRLQEGGITIRYCPLDSEGGGLDYEALGRLVTRRTKIVSLAHTSNVLGCTTDSPRVAELVRTQAHPDAIYVLDGCQSLPHGPVDVQKLGCDFFVASAHKMCGPTGVGLLFGKSALLKSMPPFLGGGEMIESVTLAGSTFAEPPGKFEAGTPNIAQAVGFGAAVKYINSIGGPAKIEEYCNDLGSYLYESLSVIPGLVLYGPKSGSPRAPLVTFSHPNAHPSDIATFLDLDDIAIRAGHHCAQPLHAYLGISHSARASLYFYNTKEEVDVFVQKLREVLVTLGAIPE
jgi:cysteine desulfurase/selenocysteine lyase